jgi:hypothetical protein
MAQNDVDNMQPDNREPKTAEEQLEGYGESFTDVENKAAAQAAGVIDAAYIDYDEALDAYQGRDDIEDLDHRRARDFPADFSDADFMRASGDTVTSSGV